MVCEVHVFPLKVTRQSKQWPEKEERDVKWLSIKQAAETVQEPMLSEIIRPYGQKIETAERMEGVASGSKRLSWDKGSATIRADVM
jgi:hypothetical protein